MDGTTIAPQQPMTAKDKLQCYQFTDLPTRRPTDLPKSPQGKHPCEPRKISHFGRANFQVSRKIFSA
ncbi:MAG: hypothetical protein ACK40X_03870, partial [Armatimonadota bacterium]